MKNKEIFIKALETLLYGGGSDAPDNVVWGCNELLNWYEIEYDVLLGIRFEEDSSTDEQVIKAIMDSTARVRE